LCWESHIPARRLSAQDDSANVFICGDLLMLPYDFIDLFFVFVLIQQIVPICVSGGIDLK